MRARKNVVFILILLLTALLGSGALGASSNEDDAGQKIIRLEERILALIPAPKSARADETVLKNIQTEIQKESKKGSLSDAYEIQLEGLKECLQKVENGLKEKQSCQKIESDIFLNYGNRSADTDNMPQFAKTAVTILASLCPQK